LAECYKGFSIQGTQKIPLRIRKYFFWIQIRWSVFLILLMEAKKNTDPAAPDTTWAFLWTLNPKIYNGTSSIRTVPKHKLLKLLFEKDYI
jgi:hypothetical protein